MPGAPTPAPGSDMHARSRTVFRVALVAALVAGPTTEAAAVAVRQPISKETRSANAMMQRRKGYGQPIALMVVGGAALLTGLIIGDDAGTVIAVSGAVVGLYGLYQYLQ